MAINIHLHTFWRTLRLAPLLVLLCSISTGAQTGEALHFDGVDDYVEVSSLPAINAIPVTLEAFVKPDLRSDGTSFPNNVLSNDLPGQYGLGFGANVYTSGSGSQSLITLEYKNGFRYINNPAGLAAGQWAHIAVVYNYNTIITYVNGSVVDNFTYSPLAPNANTTYLHIGKHNDDASYGTKRFFKGAIDEVRVWNRALCATEISAQYTCELNGTGNGLKGNYNFNAGIAGGNNSTVTTAPDATANAANGTLNNFALTGTTSNWIAPGGTSSTCSAYLIGDINVKGNGNTINSGTTTISTGDYTNVGSAALGSSVTKSFTLENTGTSSLTINSISFTTPGTNPSNFSYSGVSLPLTLAANVSTTFTVTFTPTAIANQTATITIGSDDCDENPYTFALQGTGTCATPVAYNVTGGGAYCAGGAGVAVGLSGSESGVTYQLKLGSTNQGSAIAGTGSALSFGNQTAAGIYTVLATRSAGSCTNTMTGSATVTVNPTPAATLTNGSATICSGSSVTLIFNGTANATISYSDGTTTSNVTLNASGTATVSVSPTANTTYTAAGVVSAAPASCTGTATGSFSVTVNKAPTIASVSNQNANTASNSCSAAVTYATPATTGMPTPTLSYTFSGATVQNGGGSGSGAAFSKGVTTVTLTAANSCSPNATTSFTVTVIDNVAPVINCPANITVNNSANVCGAVVNYATPTATDNCSSGSTKTMLFNGSSSQFGNPYSEQGMTITAASGQHIDAPWNVSGSIYGARIHVGYTTTFIYNSGQAFTPKTVNIIADPTSHRFIAPGGAQISPATTGVFTFPNTAAWTNITSMQWVNIGSGNVDLDDFTFTDGSGPTVSRTSGANTASGSTFPIGTTTVTYQATDASGNQSTPCSFTVTVNDNQAPVVVCPANQSLNVVANTCAAPYTIADPITDNCTGSMWGYSATGATTLPSTGNTIADGTNSSALSFNKGITTVTLSGVDGSNNIATTCSFTVTVNDNQAPVVTCPGNQNISTTPGNCTGTYTIADPVSDNCTGAMWGYSSTGATSLTSSGNSLADGANSSALVFNKGVTTVVLSGVDGSSNTATTCSFSVTVSDNENPAITAPSNVTVSGYCANAPAPASAVTLGTPTVSDNCPGVTYASNAPASYPVGNTTVTYTATDASGNKSTATQTVTITGPAVALSATSVAAPMYPMAGQKMQTVFLNFPLSKQTDTMKTTPAGGTSPYSYSWTVSGCNHATQGAAVSTGTQSYLIFAPTSQSICAASSGDNIYTYVVTVTDKNGCQTTATRKFNVVDPYVGDQVRICHKTQTRTGTSQQLILTTYSDVVNNHLPHNDALGNCNAFTGRLAGDDNEQQLSLALEAADIRVYPNPSMGNFIVELPGGVQDGAQVTVTDVQGKMVAQQLLQKGGAGKATFELGNIAKGMYLIGVKDGELIQHAKITLQ